MAIDTISLYLGYNHLAPYYDSDATQYLPAPSEAMLGLYLARCRSRTDDHYLPTQARWVSRYLPTSR